MKDGRIAQIGTPTEILTDPADDYVRSFVENVDRTKIIPARTVMRDLQEGETVSSEGPTVSPHTPLAEILPLVLGADDPVAVYDSADELQGVVDQDDVMDEVARNAEAVTQTREATREEKAMEAA
jgi:glycine betaine/proline transport system ATP-binding protein